MEVVDTPIYGVYYPNAGQTGSDAVFLSKEPGFQKAIFCALLAQKMAFGFFNIYYQSLTFVKV